MMIRRWLGFLMLLICCGATRASATVVWVYAESAYTSGASCVKTPHITSAQDGWTSLDCTAVQFANVAAPIPPGGGHTFTSQVYYTATGSGSKTCKWQIAMLSKVMACSAGTTGCSGSACPACTTDSDCPGGTCTVAPIKDLIIGTDLGNPSGTFTHTADSEYHTDVATAQNIQRYDGTVTVDCTSSECNNTDGKVFIQNYSTGSDATSCNWRAIKLDFP